MHQWPDLRCGARYAQVVADVWPQYQDVASEPIAARLLWVVRQLTAMSRLVTTVHARVEHSLALAEWHHNFHLITGSLFRHELESAGISTSTVDAEVMIGIFTIEGLLMHYQNETEQRTICDALASRWSHQAREHSGLGHADRRENRQER